ncbi:hypothetical protein [Metapseudomonas otitidis]|uniref:hypothetical protein n=1 Tax=Metapseudomonas otitidis TaxID=319939 RepID=UPI001F21F6CB|nr:hypothetical protein [Pseudomonas otitidis]MCO7558056.1 hypothetical protein [Pseudomonas otitidis]
MSLESERRANGAALEASRRGAGAALESSRRAVGTAMVARRRGEQLQRDLDGLSARGVSQRTLRQVQPRGGISGGISTVHWSESARPAASGGGGIASPVTEVSFDARQWWDDGWKTSDGLFTIPMPKKITMRDANNAEVVFEFANPAPVPAP